MFDVTPGQSNVQVMTPEQQQQLWGGIARGQNNVNAVNAGMGTLNDQLMAQAQGKGPNLGDLMLQKGIQDSNAAAASTMASSRGMNPAAAARMAMDAQAANNQGTALGAAQLRDQQQLAAQQALMQGQQNQGQLGLGLMNGSGQINDTLSGQNVNQSIANANNVTTANADSAQNSAQFWGGLVGAAGSAGASAGTAAMGMGHTVPAAAAFAAHGGRIPAGHPALQRRVPVMESPGEKVLPPELAKSPVAAAWMAAHGAAIPGRSPFRGDDGRNDTVLRFEEPGSVVLPRTKAMNPKQAAAFVAMIAKHKRGE